MFQHSNLRTKWYWWSVCLSIQVHEYLIGTRVNLTRIHRLYSFYSNLCTIKWSFDLSCYFLEWKYHYFVHITILVRSFFLPFYHPSFIPSFLFVSNLFHLIFLSSLFYFVTLTHSVYLSYSLNFSLSLTVSLLTGFRVFVVPEAATVLFLNGASPDDFGKPGCALSFQQFVIK